MYSIIAGFPFFLQKMPTFSSGYAFFTDFEALGTLFFTAKPSKISSVIFAIILSTPQTYTHFMLCDFISSIIFEFFKAINTPPFPSEASFTLYSEFINKFPSKSKIGNTFCVKNLTFSLLYPKYSCSSKKLIVSSLLSTLVIMYQYTSFPYFAVVFFNEFANISKIYFPFLSTSNLNVPFGPFQPSLVPCPPAIVTTAYWFCLKTFSPIFSISCLCLLLSLFLSIYFIGSILSFLLFFPSLFSYSLCICSKSTFKISFASSSCFSISIFSKNFNIFNWLFSFNNFFACSTLFNLDPLLI